MRMTFPERAERVLIAAMLLGMLLILQRYSLPVFQAGLAILVVSTFLQIAVGNIPKNGSVGGSLRPHRGPALRHRGDLRRSASCSCRPCRAWGDDGGPRVQVRLRRATRDQYGARSLRPGGGPAELHRAVRASEIGQIGSVPHPGRLWKSPMPGGSNSTAATSPISPPAERSIGYVPQSFALYPHLTVFDNIAYPLALAGTPRERDGPPGRPCRGPAFHHASDEENARPAVGRGKAAHGAGPRPAQGRDALRPRRPSGRPRLQAARKADGRAQGLAGGPEGHVSLCHIRLAGGAHGGAASRRARPRPRGAARRRHRSLPRAPARAVSSTRRVSACQRDRRLGRCRL